MTAIRTPSAPPVTTGTHVRVPLWAFVLMVAGLMVSYVVLQENGLVMSNWMVVHELFHDGRHALGFPCH